VLTFLGVLGSAPGAAAVPARAQEWWLTDLQVTRAWGQSEGAGITVAVLGTGVDARHPSLAGSVITGPDYSGAGPWGREPGGPYWGVEGTAVAGLIAGHRSGPGIAGVAPAATILSVRVTLEFNDPLAADQAVSRRLPDAIAEGIRYAAGHGARIIDLPLDPGTLGLTDSGDPAAAGGSPAERAAVGYALSKGILLVAPAGDDAQGPAIANYPAAYPGVIAVGAVDRAGRLAPFSSTRSHASLAAPGVSLVAAVPPDGYGTISSTSTASGIVAGVAALVLSRFPRLTVAQVTRALIESTGAGYGTVDAIRALDAATVITAASRPHRPAAASRPARPAPRGPAGPRRAAESVAGSVLRDAVVTVGALIALLLGALLVARSRRERGRSAAVRRARIRGQHGHRAASAAARPSAYTGGISRSPGAPSGPVAAPWPGSGPSYRAGRGAASQDGSAGPPWEPAPEPERVIGPLPAASGTALPLAPERGIRVPGDMAAPAAAPRSPGGMAAGDRTAGHTAAAAGAEPGPPPPVGLNRTVPAAGFERVVEPEGSGLAVPPAGFDLAKPAFGLTPPAFGVPPASGPAGPAGPGLPARQSLGFAAAPVPADYAAPPGQAAPRGAPGTAGAADPGYLWELASTDAFPAATRAGLTADPAAAPEAAPPGEAADDDGGGTP
jgi:hypothetical protein